MKGHKENLSKFNGVEITQTMFSDHNTTTHEQQQKALPPAS